MVRGLGGVYWEHQVHPLGAEEYPPVCRLCHQVACRTPSSKSLEMQFHCSQATASKGAGPSNDGVFVAKTCT